MDTATRIDDEISVRELIAVLTRQKWLIFSIAAVVTLAGAVATKVVPKSYRAVTIISPVSNSAGASQLGGLSSLVSQFGGLASLAGVSLAADNKRSESVAVLESEALTEDYIRQNNLLPVLYASKWDAVNRRFRVTDPEKMPTLWKANDYFKKRIREVSVDSKTGLVVLEISWKDPKLAAKWANDLVKLANDTIRSQAIAESERNIAYLNQQAAKTDVVGVKQAIYTILQTEINKEMLARGNDQYAFKVLDPAFPPERASFPQPLLWVAAALAGGLFLGCVVAIVRATWMG
jgi:uncharacterized protein involved in exopolysaccharide biosynthesis